MHEQRGNVRESLTQRWPLEVDVHQSALLSADTDRVETQKRYVEVSIYTTYS